MHLSARLHPVAPSEDCWAHTLLDVDSQTGSPVCKNTGTPAQFCKTSEARACNRADLPLGLASRGAVAPLAWGRKQLQGEGSGPQTEMGIDKARLAVLAGRKKFISIIRTLKTSAQGWGR